MGKINEKMLQGLREALKSEGWDAVVLINSDPHSSEYLAPHWQVVKALSGYDGEGNVVITKDFAGLWTDSRYFIQADAHFADSEWTVMKMGQPGVLAIPDWLQSQGFKVVAMNGECVNTNFATELSEKVGCAAADATNYIDKLWEDRAKIPSTDIISIENNGYSESRESKIAWLRGFMKEQGCSWMAISALDEIAWLLNIRANDIEYNPYALSFLYISQKTIHWCVRKEGSLYENEQLSPITQATFEELQQIPGFKINPYHRAKSIVGLLSKKEDVRIFADPATINFSLFQNILASFGAKNHKGSPSPIKLRKAVKTEAELEAIRQAHLEDGVAMEKYFYWLENQIASGAKLDEMQVSLKLTEFRSAINDYKGNSFETISAYGPNGALPHYHTPAEGSAQIQPRSFYLVDSGGQYLSGTTDITRTMPMGECSQLEKEDYTLVLKGMIDLDMAIFPAGTAGCQIDALARNPLWQTGRNFGHGTGHGVGFFLGVHEGPQQIRQNFNSQALLPRMVMSDEPGLYRAGQWGIRHENMIACVPAGSTEFCSDWLKFETLTLCHFDTSAIIPELLGEVEIKWLNDYNQKVYEKISPKLTAEEAAWLFEKTRPI